MTTYDLTTAHYSFECNPDEGVFNLSSNRVGLPGLHNCRLMVTLNKNNKKINVLDHGWLSHQVIKTSDETEHGKLKQLEFSIFYESEGLIFRITFASSETFPIFLWKIVIENQSDSPITIDKIHLLELGSSKTGKSGNLQFGHELMKPDFAFHSHGWQSWSFSGSYHQDQKQKQTNLHAIQDVMLNNPGTPVFKKAGLFSSDFFGVIAERTTRTGLTLGFLSQKQHFGTVTADLTSTIKLGLWANGDATRIDPGNRMETDWAVFHTFYLDQVDPIEEYYSAVQREHHITIKEEMPAGWCSWYHFYQNIDQEKIENNLKSIQANQETLPLRLVQIDDGFQKQVGDWFKNDKGFPNGIKPLADKIKQAGFTPGLWLAPFILHPRSEFVFTHPEMILRKKSGSPVNAGFVWNVFTQALDLTYPGALDYALDVVGTAAKEWGFPYLKLDFLYAGALDGKRFDQTRTRAQILRNALEKIRERVGEKTFLLGCGVPIGSALGIFDANRIGADVSGDWTPQFLGIGFPFKKEPSMPSARNAIQNVLTRAEQHQRWWINDPDCLLLREETNLTLAEVQSLASAIAITGGSLLISDDLPALSKERLQIAEVMLPVIGKRAYVMDWLDTTTPHNLRLDLENQSGDWFILARFNWKEVNRELFISFPDFCLGKNDYWVFSFWDQKIYRVQSGNPLNIPNIPEHGVALLAIRKVNRENAVYLGSSLHISMGLEISQWAQKENEVEFELSLPRRTSGHLTLALPTAPKSALIDGKSLSWEKIEEDVYRFQVVFSTRAKIQIKY